MIVQNISAAPVVKGKTKPKGLQIFLMGALQPGPAALGAPSLQRGPVVGSLKNPHDGPEVYEPLSELHGEPQH